MDDMQPILVVKVGTSTLLGSGEAPSRVFDYVAASIAVLRDQYRIILVTSGAIGFGVRRLELPERPRDVHQLQALSMIGQVGLLRRWREAFGEDTLGQVLVTRRDLEGKQTAQLFRQSIEAMWQYGGVPVVNENDAVSNEEISFGDNDRLAAEVAVTLGAQAVVFLTDQDGIQAHYQTERQVRLPEATIDEASGHIVASVSAVGTGGASSKLQAAQLALDSGIVPYIAHAGKSHTIEDTLSGKVGTKLVQ